MKIERRNEEPALINNHRRNLLSHSDDFKIPGTRKEPGIFIFRNGCYRTRTKRGLAAVAGGVSEPASVNTRTDVSGVVITPSAVQP